MRSVLPKFLTVLSLFSTAAFAEAPFKVFEHKGVCNEIQTDSPEGAEWKAGSTTSGHKPEFEFAALKNNQIDKVPFGLNNQITFEYQGPKIDGQSLPTGQSFGMDVNNLFRDRAIVGKANIAIDANRSGMMTVPPLPRDKGWRQRIYFATLFAPKDMRRVAMITTCTYIPGDLPKDFDGCVWVDQNSRATNGLPYCW